MSYRTKSWMCSHCGYVMDAASSLEPAAEMRAPRDGDVSVCINCATPYVMRGRWIVLPQAEHDALPAELKHELLKARIACMTVIKTDLSAGQGGRA